MHLKYMLCLLASLILSDHSQYASGADAADPEIVELRAERDRLRIELAQAKLRLSKLEDELADVRAYFDAILKKEVQPNEGVNAIENAPALPNPDEHTKTKRKDQILGSIPSFFANLPREMRPNSKEGWTDFNLPKALEWTNDHGIGRLVDVTVEVRQTSIYRIPDPTNRNLTLGWQVRIFTASEKAKLFGMDHTISYASGNGFTLTVDEATALRAKNIKQGQRLRIRGEVSRIHIESYGVETNKITVQLRQVLIEGLTPQKPK